MICYETRTADTHYSVRRAGGSIRLYSNGVFHSQWNPDRPFAGGVWDCLSLPALYMSPSQRRRVLVLGVGGGAVIRQLQSLIEIDCLTGIELDRQHLHIARRWFGVGQPAVQLVEANAVEWVASYRGPCFDLVIDDLFGHAAGETLRSVALDERWIGELSRVSALSGMLVVNTVGGRQLKAALPALRAAGFQHGYHWSVLGYANAVGVLFRQAVQARVWLQHLQTLNLASEVRRSARRPSRRVLRF